MLLYIFVLLPVLVNSANILAIYFHAGKSHHILGKVLLQELAKRGHNVTMASPFPLKQPFPNYTDVHLNGIVEDQLARESMFMKMNRGHALAGIFDILELTRSQTELTLNHTEMHKLLQSGTKFDLVVIDWFLNHAILVFGDLFKAPVIPIASHGTGTLVHSLVGNPAVPCYIPNTILPFHKMSFLGRFINSLVYVVFEVIGRINVNHHLGLIQKYFNRTVTFEQLQKNVALVFTNAHFSFESPRPTVPNIIPVGGFHVRKNGNLPKDLKELMDNAKDGVIYFSLGSNMKSILIPEAKQREILRVFAEIPCQILWKWEKDDLKDKPSNVVIKKWFPQTDILSHPNLKLFISHGGLLSAIEALFYGVPILGIPIFGDQKANILAAVDAGYAAKIELEDLNQVNFRQILQEMLKNSSYLANARKRSKLLHDQPISPLERAVFWVEYVIRHKGALHLKNEGVNLNWYQYLLLDVLILAGIAVFVPLILLFLGLKRIYKTYKFPNRRKTVKRE